MACGLRVIRTPSRGFEDQIIDEANGFRIPFNDATVLASKISDLLDETVQRKMGLDAPTHSQKVRQSKNDIGHRGRCTIRKSTSFPQLFMFK